MAYLLDFLSQLVLCRLETCVWRLSLIAACVVQFSGCGAMWGSITTNGPSPSGGGSTIQYFSNQFSNIFRSVGSTQLTQLSEVTTYAGAGAYAVLAGNFHEVPNVLMDDEGYYNSDSGCGASCTPIVSITSAQHAAFANCGMTQTSLVLRIADCATQNGTSASWKGSASGSGGQASWYLVTRLAANAEVWLDGNTGLIWSSRLTMKDNWCRASGNAQANDPSGYCNSATYQPQYPTPESDCAEPAGSVPTPGWCSNGTAYLNAAGCTTAGGTWTANADNWAAGNYGAQKGGMGANSAVLKIRWRLPTIHDFELAEVDGIRFVMPDMGAFSTSFEWTSGSVSYNRANA